MLIRIVDAAAIEIEERRDQAIKRVSHEREFKIFFEPWGALIPINGGVAEGIRNPRERIFVVLGLQR